MKRFVKRWVLSGRKHFEQFENPFSFVNVYWYIVNVQASRILSPVLLDIPEFVASPSVCWTLLLERDPCVLGQNSVTSSEKDEVNASVLEDDVRLIMLFVYMSVFLLSFFCHAFIFLIQCYFPVSYITFTKVQFFFLGHFFVYLFFNNFRPCTMRASGMLTKRMWNLVILQAC